MPSLNLNVFIIDGSKVYASLFETGLGDTVFTLGFPDPGLQGFAPLKVTGDEWRVT
ncbi:MAG: hypothetical protein ACREFE_19740 [Limisphaerales bacterium]